MKHVTQTQLNHSQLRIYVPDKLVRYSKANTLAFGTSWLCQTGALQQDKLMATVVSTTDVVIKTEAHECMHTFVL